MNKATLLGNVGRDPELIQTNTGTTITKFSLATNRKDKNGEKRTTWHNIKAFNKTAEILNQYVKQGQQILIEGQINNETWEKDDGTKGFTSEVIVDNFHFVGNKVDSGAPVQQAAPQAEELSYVKAVPTAGVDTNSPPF